MPRESLATIALPERHPPFAPEAEISVLGGMLIDNDAVPKALEIVDESMFYRPAHKTIFRAMDKMFQRGMVVDPTTIAETLKDSGELEQAGGLDYLAEMLDAVPTAANIEYHARIIRDRAVRRQVIGVCSDAIRSAYEPGDIATEAMLDYTQSRLFEISAERDGELVSVRKFMLPTFARIEQLQAAKGGITGVASGLVDLDRMTGGFQPGNLIIVAGRPSQGKTALAWGFALHASIACQIPSAVFSLEQSREELLMRGLCHEGLVDLGRVLRGQLQDDDYVRLAQASGHLNSAPIWIDDRGGQTVTQIRAKARKLKAEKPDLGLIVVDYIQLCHSDGENQNIRVGKVSGGLKELAKELRVPVVALSQLSRANEQRADRRPQLSDLRDSGSLEQDADLVMFVHRPEYYLSPSEAASQSVVGKAEIGIGKQRNGPTGIVDAYYRKECTRFESYAEEASWAIRP